MDRDAIEARLIELYEGQGLEDTARLAAAVGVSRAQVNHYLAELRKRGVVTRYSRRVGRLAGAVHGPGGGQVPPPPSPDPSSPLVGGAGVDGTAAIWQVVTDLAQRVEALRSEVRARLEAFEQGGEGAMDRGGSPPLPSGGPGLVVPEFTGSSQVWKVYMPADEVAAIKALAARRGVHPSKLVQGWCAEGLAREGSR